MAAAGVCLGQEIRLGGSIFRAAGRGELVVYVAGAREAPPVLGTSRVEGGETVFSPRFGLQPGVRYRVVFRGSGPEVQASFEIPREPRAAGRVEAVYPSAAVLPENQLKFYLHFSTPMSRGEVYRRVKLLEANGEPVELPFLELDQELWDGAGKRLTLLFDPGRVKRELKPHREAGTPLREGRSYTLVIDREWPDDEGRPLAQEYRKPFRVGAADREPPDPRKWVIRAPPASTREPLEVELGEPLDRALLQRVVEVADGRGVRVEGQVEVGPEERIWRWQPRAAWAAGEYRVRVEKILEDLAGNTIGKPFEVDVFERVEERISREAVEVRFRVR